ncbi:MAG: PEP-CTERM sorting domain-containing protein [Rubrivivax sp.]|nr:PEP-CTERM sorting domain-containing protein [Rubrivivax sp.]
MKTSTPLTRAATAAVLALGTAAPAHAAVDGQISRQALVAPAAMTSTCGGMNPGVSAAGVVPGDLFFFSTAAHNCQSDFGLVGTQQSSALFTDPSPTADVTALAQAEAGMGWARARSDFTGRNTAPFPAALATAGWEDLVTITSPGLDGQAGRIEMVVYLNAQLKGIPAGNVSASIRLAAHGVPSDPSPIKLWAGQGQGGFPYDETVDELVVLRAGFVFGTPFELGVFALTSANTASVASFDPLTGSFAHIHELSWQGISAVLAGGSPVPYSISSASGLDWTAPVVAPPPVPEPASWLLMLAGAAGLLQFRRSTHQEKS